MSIRCSRSSDDESQTVLSTTSQEALQMRGNDVCADCKAPNPGWVETTRPITLCRSCATEHHILGSDVSRVKCILDDGVGEQVFQELGRTGNDTSNARYEGALPAAFKRPDPLSKTGYRKNFIAAKYKRHEFCREEETGLRRLVVIPQAYISGDIAYSLLKRGRERDIWLPRGLKVSSQTGTLRYFERGTELGCIPLGTLNVALTSEKDFDPGSESNALILVVTYPEANSRRSLFFKGFEFLNGRDIVEWYVAIRHAKMDFLDLHDGKTCSDDIKQMGWLYKRGAQKTDRFQKRWFVIEGNRVRYSEFPMDAFPKNEFTLTYGPGYGVMKGIDGDTETPFAFTVIKPGRDYLLHANSASFDLWIAAFASLCSQTGPLEGASQ